jgi:Rieske Fe-S protein
MRDDGADGAAVTPDAAVRGTGVTRRAVVAGTGTAVVSAALAACEVYGGSSDQAAEPGPEAGSGTAPAGSGAALTTTATVPLGGGQILKEQRVVVTQPTAGTFRAFSTVCTHQGCDVTSVEGGTINCACHGSKFAIADGSVAGGPAPKPLAPRNIRVDGDSIVLA